MKMKVKGSLRYRNEQLTNGSTIQICNNCFCENIPDNNFHDFFRRVNWTLKAFQYLNRIQDNWSVLNHSTAQPQQNTKLNNCASNNCQITNKITRKLNSEQIIIDYLAYLYEQMVMAEQFYIKMRNDYVDQFIKL